jgi:hypothetical protein
VLTQSQIRAYWAPRCTGPFATVSLYGAGKVTVDAAIVSAVKALDKVLIAYSYETRRIDTGAYNCRSNTSGTGWSMHAYGVAVDINWQSNPYSRVLRTDMLRNGDGKMPHRICMIRTNNGRQVWNWGGFWTGNKDAMHFEIVCTPADLRTGINWSTVYGGGVVPTPTPTPTPPTQDWFDMATREDLRVVVREELNKLNDEGRPLDVQNTWIKSQITSAVASIKSNSATHKNSLAALIRKFATAMGKTI